MMFGRSESATLSRLSTKPISTSFRFKQIFVIFSFHMIELDDFELQGSKADLLIDTGVGIHEVLAGINVAC